ncbi:hypothetical protein IDH44_04595 [Paenibacillus sp. IB182496]|uniref:Uncharacterized protein n=2 Tax=Paenibacillus sabuli TaxID=2772509 RepID=A0A927BS05_9BACL|nr:hypothetical protein [Paenibacillus sabuli]
MDTAQMKQWCANHMHRYVLAQTKDGYCCDGIVEHIDDEVVCLAVPVGDGGGQWGVRNFFPYPYPGTPFATPPLYPYPYYPRRRFARQVLPLAVLLGLTLLPYY